MFPTANRQLYLGRASDLWSPWQTRRYYDNYSSLTLLFQVLASRMLALLRAQRVRQEGN